MHFLNPFPTLLIYSLWAPVTLRLALGYFFIIFGTAHLKDSRWKTFGILELILAFCLVIGFGVQIDSLIAILFLLSPALSYQKIKIPHAHPREFYWLLIAIAISLLLSGAGLPAVDLPL